MGLADFPTMIEAAVNIDLLLKDAVKNRKATFEEREIAELLRSAGDGKGGLWRDIKMEYTARLEGKDNFISVFQDDDFHQDIKRIIDKLKSIRERCAEGKSGRIGQSYANHLHQCILAWEMINKIEGREISLENLKVVLDFVAKMISTGEESVRSFERLNKTNR
jgi:hypothetical protein